VSQAGTLTASRAARILVAEDEELILAVFQAILKKAGFEVVAASNGIQAASIFDSDGKFDLVITDLALPGLDGTALAAHIRKTRPEMKIIFSTGNITHAPQQAAEQFKATFLPKPFGFEELVTTVNNALES
jgi:two-component system, cell cycle sensor histidine kinase and response regulator CckA